MPSYQFTVTYEVERVSGKFAGREELTEAITDALYDAAPDLSGLGADGDSEYEVVDTMIKEVAQTRKRRAKAT